MRFETATDCLIQTFSARRPLRAGSLIITVYGDAIAPRGGVVWLGSLIKVLEPFGLNQRLVRTSVFRLAKDGWLESEQIGRRSYYGLTAVGRRRFEQATRRIYGEPMRDWDGRWTLVLLAPGDADSRDVLKKELSWLGFGALAQGIMAHPAPDAAALRAVLEDSSASEPLVMKGSTLTGQSSGLVDERVHSCWKLDQLEKRYLGFLDAFRPVYEATRRKKRPDPLRCLAIRTLLIHEYRKILLRDPQLPVALLPAGWAGAAAYQLCGNLYRLTHTAAEQQLTAVLETADGPLPGPEPFFYTRFGGLTQR